VEETIDFRFIKANGKKVVIAVVGDKKVGALRLKPFKDSYQVDSVTVSKDYRGVGIGKELYRAANDKLTKGLYSDQAMTKDAERVWNSFISNGEAEKTEDNRYIMIKESKMKKYSDIKALLEKSTIKEGEKTAFINGQPAEYTDKKELDKLKDNSDVESIKTADGEEIKEERGIEFNVEETQAIAREVGKALATALREVGEEIDSAKIHHVEPNSFEIFIKYKNNFEDDFAFHIDQDTLHLADFSFDKEIGEVGVKPSGEAIVHRDVIKNNMVKHFQALNETEDVSEGRGDGDDIVNIIKSRASEDGVSESDAAEEIIEYLKDHYRSSHIKKSIKEFGPMQGSGNTDRVVNPYVEQIGKLEGKIWDIGGEIENEWEKVSGQYLDGDDRQYWSELDDTELENAIDDAKRILTSYVREAKANKTDKDAPKDDSKDTFEPWEDLERADREVEYGKDMYENEDEETPRQKYIRMLEIYKNGSKEKRKQMKPILVKAAKAIGISLDLSGLI